MGAKVTIDDRVAVVEGVERLTGAQVRASDLRAGAGAHRRRVDGRWRNGYL